MTTILSTDTVPNHRSRVVVVRADGEFRLVAERPFAAGEGVLSIDGVIVDEPTRYSVQVGRGQHVEMPAGTTVLEELDRYVWRFLNHACAANAILRGRELIAVRDIGVWEEVTFDYNTTEFEMAHPFPCRCGARDCVGEVRGYAHLTAAQRGRIDPHVARHVVELAARRDTC